MEFPYGNDGVSLMLSMCMLQIYLKLLHHVQNLMKPEFYPVFIYIRVWISSIAVYGKWIVIASRSIIFGHILKLQAPVGRNSLACVMTRASQFLSRCKYCAPLVPSTMHSNWWHLPLQKELFCFAKHESSTAEALEGSRVSVSFLPGTFITQAVPVLPANYRRYSHRIRAVDVVMGPCCARVTKPVGLHKHWGQHLKGHLIVWSIYFPQ